MQIGLAKLNDYDYDLARMSPTPTPLPPLRAVRAFEAVGRLGSVTRAAEELDVSPGAITLQIHALEKHLKVHLVERVGRGIALTSWGAIYLRRIAAAMDEIRRANDDIERARRSNHISVSALPSLATKWLGPLLFQWKDLHPNSSVLVEGLDDEPRLNDGGVDFRISYGLRQRAHQRISHLFTDHVVAVASPALLKSIGPIRHPRDILRRPLLWIDWGPEYVAPPTWRDWFAASAVSTDELRCDLTFSLSSAAIDAAIEGRGFALAQNSMIASALEARTLAKVFPLTLPLPESYFLASNGAAVDKPVGSAFRAWILSESRRFDTARAQS